MASAFAPVSPFVAVETGFASFIIGADVAGNFSRVLGVETPTHPDGRAKAEYLGRLGYSQDTFLQLEGDLREQVRCRDTQPGRTSLYGQK